MPMSGRGMPRPYSHFIVRAIRESPATHQADGRLSCGDHPYDLPLSVVPSTLAPVPYLSLPKYPRIFLPVWEKVFLWRILRPR